MNEPAGDGQVAPALSALMQVEQAMGIKNFFNESDARLIEKACSNKRFPLAVLIERRNHGNRVFECELADPTLEVPISLADHLSDVLHVASPVHIERSGTTVFIAVPIEQPDDPAFGELVKKPIQKGVPFLAGVNIHDDVVCGDLAVEPHLFVIGSSGSGKSTYVKCFVLSLHHYLADKVKIAAIDIVKPDGFDFIPNDMLWAEKAVRPAKAELLLRKLKSEVERRFIAPDEAACHLVVLIDEVAVLREEPRIDSMLKYLAKVGRAARVSLVLVSQSPTDVPDDILQELRCRAVFRLQSTRASRRAIGSDEATGLRIGEMMFQYTGTKQLIRTPNMALLSNCQVS